MSNREVILRLLFELSAFFQGRQTQKIQKQLVKQAKKMPEEYVQILPFYFYLPISILLMQPRIRKEE